MLNFSCSFDAYSTISRDIRSLQSRNRIQDVGDTAVRLIGQEKDGTLIFTWNALLPEQLDGPQRTHIIIYNPVKQKSKVVFIHDRSVEIVNCTINQEHTFLGFVTHEIVNGIDSAGKKCKQALYRAYLAEVAPQNRVFYLNIERTNYLMLQFLYGKYRSQTTTRESHVLVFLHRESIGLYHLPITRAGEGVIMTGQPKKEQVFHRKFVWSQWDMDRQCLYVAHFRKLNKHPTGRVMTESFLTCYQFTEQEFSEFTLEIPIDVPGGLMKPSNRIQYLSLGPCKCIPDSSMNMRMLIADDCTMCLCFQQPYNSKSRSQCDGIDTTDLQYTVYMVHHGKRLNCTVSKIPMSIADKAQLLFTLLDGHLLVVLPGQFVHLLDVSIDTEPSYHVLYHDIADVQSDGQEDADRKPYIQYLTPYHSDNPEHCRVFDSSTGQVCDISINTDALCHLFEESTMMTTRSAIMNYAVSTSKDSLLPKKLMHILSNDICSPEVSQIMEDYLISGVFNDMKKMVDSSVVNLLPCSTVIPYTHQIEKNFNGERLAKISYSNMRRCHFALKKWYSTNQDSIWDRLSRHAHMTASDLIQKFSVVDIQKEVDNPTMDSEINERQRANTSLFQKFVDATKSAFSSGSPEKTKKSGDSMAPVKMDGALGPAPPFLKSNAEEQENNDQILSTVQKVVNRHLTRFLAKSAPERNKKLAELFASCMLSNSIRLCHVIWSVLHPADQQFNSHLSFPANEQELALLQMFERYVLATSSQYFPLPAGFPTFFTTLGFRCLKFRIFIQYVDQGIFELTPDFVSQLLEDLRDDDMNNEQMKFQIVSRLPQQESLNFIQQWENPVCSAFLVQQYISACMKEDSEHGETLTRARSRSVRQTNRSQENTTASPFYGSVSFPPLATLMKNLQAKDRNLAMGKTRFGDFSINSHFIEETALRNMLQQTKFSLNDISF